MLRRVNRQILQHFSLFAVLLSLILGCKPDAIEKPFNMFGNVYRIDSVAGKEGLDDPRYIVISRDSLFQMFAYWEYSFSYETQLRINDSVQVLNWIKEKYTIEPTGEGFWLNFPNGKRRLYSQDPWSYDSMYKYLRTAKTQESLLFGKWKFINDKSIAKDRTKGKNILTCTLDESSALRFVIGKSKHKLVQLESFTQNRIDTCLRRDFRLDGSSVLIFDYDIFTPWTILKLDNRNLVLQGPGDVLYFEKTND